MHEVKGRGAEGRDAQDKTRERDAEVVNQPLEENRRPCRVSPPSRQ